MASSSSESALGALAPGADSHRQRRLSSGSWVPFLAPAVGVLALIGFVPLLYAIQLSLTSFSFILPDRTGQWVGLDNYASLATNAGFLSAVVRTGLFTGAAVFLELMLGLLLAAGLNSTGRERGPLLGLLIIPMILTPVIVGLMFNFAVNPQFGPLASLLRSATGSPVDALGTPVGAYVTLVLVDVWQWSSFMALMLWAGMQTLSAAPLEAASVDGANALQRLRLIVVPMLRPVIVVAVIFRSAEAVREFDKVFVLTGGGPGSATEVLDLFTYRIAFVNWDMSLGAAMGVVEFVVALAAAYLFFRLVTRSGRMA
ncbi:MAG TPA: sugar ABC transporter permease [Candidatus Limnocylindrales bacterium]|nr:sugar ABC transporter permease [Candidatus Limnocylindrales bacterium]